MNEVVFSLFLLTKIYINWKAFQVLVFYGFYNSIKKNLKNEEMAFNLKKNLPLSVIPSRTK